MSQRSMIQSPLPEVSSKELELIDRIDNAIVEAFLAIRQLHHAVKQRCTGDVISAEALTKLLRASWAVENSQDSARHTVINRDKKSYKEFLTTMKGIKTSANFMTNKCGTLDSAPWKLIAEALLFGGDVMVLVRNYTK